MAHSIWNGFVCWSTVTQDKLLADNSNIVTMSVFVPAPRAGSNCRFLCTYMFRQGASAKFSCSPACSDMFGDGTLTMCSHGNKRLVFSIQIDVPLKLLHMSIANSYALLKKNVYGRTKKQMRYTLLNGAIWPRKLCFETNSTGIGAIHNILNILGAMAQHCFQFSPIFSLQASVH